MAAHRALRRIFLPFRNSTAVAYFWRMIKRLWVN